MPNYRRPNVSGGTYFITQVTYQRESCFDIETPLDGSYLTDSEARPRNRFWGCGRAIAKRCCKQFAFWDVGVRSLRQTTAMH